MTIIERKKNAAYLTDKRPTSRASVCLRLVLPPGARPLNGLRAYASAASCTATHTMPLVSVSHRPKAAACAEQVQLVARARPTGWTRALVTGRSQSAKSQVREERRLEIHEGKADIER